MSGRSTERVVAIPQHLPGVFFVSADLPTGRIVRASLRPPWASNGAVLRRLVYGAVVLALVVWGLTDVRMRGRVDPLKPGVHKTDVTVYTGAGKAIFDGNDPYLVTSPRGWHYLYPPLFAILMAPLAAVDTQWQSVAFFAISVLAGWGCFVEGRKLWRMATPIALGQSAMPARLLWVATGAVLLPALNCLQRGQLGILLLYPLLLGFRMVISSRSWLGVAIGGIILALPGAIKVIPALPVAFVCWQLIIFAWWRNRPAKNEISLRPVGYDVQQKIVLMRPWSIALAASAGVATGVVLFLFIVPSIVVGPAKNIAYLQTWVHRVGANQGVGAANDFAAASKRNQSFVNGIYRLGNWIGYELAGTAWDDSLDDVSATVQLMPMDHPAVRWGLIAVRGLLLALLAAVGWLAARNNDRSATVVVCALSCMMTLVVSPLAWAHYYVAWWPALCIVPYWLWCHERRRLATYSTLFACTVVWTHYLLLPWAGRAGLLGISGAVWFVIVAVAMSKSLSAAQATAQTKPAIEKTTRATVQAA